jgi:hypothetical protein
MDGKPAYKNLLKEELKARRQHLMVPYHRRARGGGGVIYWIKTTSTSDTSSHSASEKIIWAQYHSMPLYSVTTKMVKGEEWNHPQNLILPPNSTYWQMHHVLVMPSHIHSTTSYSLMKC